MTTATFTTAALAVGSHSITAVYAGDAERHHQHLASADLQRRPGCDNGGDHRRRRPTAVYGQSVTFTATVAVTSPGAGPPTGTVTFKDGTTTLGTGTLSTSGGVTTATFTTTALAVGIALDHRGLFRRHDDLTSTSAALTFDVAQDATTTTVAASPSRRELRPGGHADCHRQHSQPWDGRADRHRQLLQRLDPARNQYAQHRERRDDSDVRDRKSGGRDVFLHGSIWR